MQSQPAPLSADQLVQIAAIVKEDAGLHISQATEALVLSRLSRRLRQSGIADFSAYLALVTTDKGQTERAAMIEALTTNTTRFFREPAHFDILVENLVPHLRVKLAQGGRVRIWSAGCSTGEEPYSIAAALYGALPEVAQQDLRILATDINRSVLATAEAGLYPASRGDDLTAAQRASLFDDPADGQLRVKKVLRDMVTFLPLNLMGDWPMKGRFDAIFCRNVAIYMDLPTQARLWSRLDGALDPDGILFIGHSERLGPDLLHRLQPCGTTAFCRNQGFSQSPIRKEA